MSGAVLIAMGLLAIAVFFLDLTAAALTGNAWIRGGMFVAGVALGSLGVRRFDVGRRLARFP